ncbi:MAG TPA: DNA mismatch repair protein MutS, partial [Phycisphaerales bacterium]|nr:DNA mismatch repair protein MutS [Phycisphaerales bacterium]
QTLKNAERFITPELKTFEEKVLTAESRAVARERELFAELCETVTEKTDRIAEYAAIVARIDCLLGLAEIASKRGWTRPEFTDVPGMEITGGRHPVLEAMLRDSFVPNDCSLAGSGNRATMALITGPNMAGKSTFIRQVALTALLAHAGSWVPADSTRLGLMDRIMTRIGASDELHSGRSTFMVEMTETANILHHATPNSLVILDEIGRGTSTLDGLSLAWAITETLAERGAPTLFATHYHELTGLADTIEAVTNLHVMVKEWNDQIIFLHRIQPGRTDRSYGIHVARLAGLPKSTLKRAQAVLDTLVVNATEGSALNEGAPEDQADQLSLFNDTLEHPVILALKQLSLESLSPMDAFDRLRELIAQIDDQA